MQKTKTFDFIDPQLNIDDVKLVAKLKGYSVHSKKNNLAKLFNEFWKTANSMSANSYKIDSVFTKNDACFVILSIYFLSAKKLQENLDLYPKNKVFVHGDIIDKDTRVKKIKVNKESITLSPLEYIGFQNEIDQEIKVNIGGILGATTWIKGSENRMPVHMSFSNFGIGPYIGYNSIGVTVNTGRIYPVELNMGEFLIRVFNEK
jgi:hypothetical protein